MNNFLSAWNATNDFYVNQTKNAINETFKRRHESKHVRKACLDNIVFYRKNTLLPTPEQIDRAMLADKLADGYNQRNIERAIKLEQKNAY